MASDQEEQADSAALQSQNQKLVQQLEAQKHETHALEKEMKELKDFQSSYDATLMLINKSWNQLVDDLVLLGIRAGSDLNFLEALNHEEPPAETNLSCFHEDIFLSKLLQSTDLPTGGVELTKIVQDAISLRRAETMKLMKHLQDAFEMIKTRNEYFTQALDGNLPVDGVMTALQSHSDYLKVVVENICKAMDCLQQKHDKFLSEIEANADYHRTNQLEIKRLSVELDENLAELEQSRRKLVVLQMQKHGGSIINSVLANSANGNCLGDKSSDSSMHLQELRDAVDEAKTLAANRLLELQETQEDNLILAKQLEDLEDQVVDEKFVLSSKAYTLLDDRLHNLKKELGRYKGMIELLQNDKKLIVQRETELSTKSESIDNLKQSVRNYEVQIENLEHQLGILISEKEELEIKVEEVIQETGKKDFKNEIHVLSASLSKEIYMMENQLNRAKEAALEVLSLRKEADTMKSILAEKMTEHNNLMARLEEQESEVRSLKAVVENLESEKQELLTMLDMYGQEFSDTRTSLEIRESEDRARQEAECLRRSLDEHSLELRVKAATEAEAACRHRLSDAEVEIQELRSKLDASERDALELREAIRIKESDAGAYISDIETIGQAYEDMQTQNQNLLKQVADRDDYHIKLVSESVNMKQSYSSLLSEKQSLLRQLQQIRGSLESSRAKVDRGEEQMEAHVGQALKTSVDNRHLILNIDKTNLELADAEKEVKWLRSVVASSEKEYEQNQKKIEELKAELERERGDRKKLEEEYEEVKKEVLEMTSEDPEVTIKKLQDEITECKAILKCGVCFDRPKEVVITKCYHLFCSPCIQRNLEIRHRKCPGCGTAFGQSDVREVNI